MQVSFRATTPDPFTVQTEANPVLYDIASELQVKASSDTIIIDVSSENYETTSHDLKVAMRIAQVIGPIIAIFGVIICAYAFEAKKVGFTGLGLAVSFLGCAISCGATCYRVHLKESGRI